MKRIFALLSLSSIVALLLIPAPRVMAAFGVTSSGGYFTVDSGAGLVFDVQQAGGDITRIVYNGVNLQEDADDKASQLISGLGAESVTATNINNQYIKITLQTSPSNGVVANLTHYFLVKNGDNTIYMATYVTQAPSIGELRWITRLRTPQLPNGPTPSDLRNNTGAVESSDVYGMADGTTRSKYYGDNITHGKDRAMDLTYCGAKGHGIGVWMVYGNRESDAGGPFYRDIQNQYGSSQQEIYNYMFSGHAKLPTQDWRMGVLYGPYALVFNDGHAPSYPINYSWAAGLNLSGFVPDSDRGTVSGTVNGIQDGFEAVVGFSNTNAQYWATAAADGSYTSPLMKPGTYNVTLYQQELEVATSSVTVTTGNNATKNLTAAFQPTILWRLGQRDGTPAGLLNADKVISMHPSDVRMDSWTTAALSTPYVVGGSTPCSKGLPCYEWKDIGSQYVQFNLTPAQVVNSTIRIGITASQNARVGIEIGGLSTYTSTYPTGFDNNSRSMTVGTWRGGNYEAVFSVNSSYLSSGSNVLKINAISGSGGTGYLSPGFSIDYIEMSGPASTTPPSPTGLVAAASQNGIEVSWNAVDWAEGYVLERSTTSNGTYTTLSSNIGPAHYTDTSADPNTIYFYRVSSVNSAGTSNASAAVGSVPDAPPGLAAAPASSTQIDLTWSAATAAESYTIKRATTSSGPYTTVATGVTTTNYTDIGLTKATTYYYVVNAANASGEGGDSAEANATTLGSIRVANSWGGYVVELSDSTFNGFETPLPFSMNGGNCVVLLLGYSAAENSVTGVTFAGEPMTKAATAGRSEIWYLKNPAASSGTFQIQSTTATSKYIMSAISLVGMDRVADTDANNQGAFPQSLVTTTTSDDSLVMFSSLNWANIDGRCPDYSSGPASNQLFRAWNSVAYIAAAQYYGGTSAAGTYTNVINATYNNYPPYSAAVAFDAIESTPPAAPTGLLATAGNGSVALDWNDNSEGDLGGYTIYRSTISGSGYSPLGTTNAATSAYTDHSVINGITYYYKVSATDTNLNGSAFSSMVSATPTPATTPPDTPTGLSAVGVATNQIDLSWTAATNATGYNVKRAEISGGPYSTIAVNVSGPSYSDNNGLSNGITYFYEVSATNSIGESADCAEASAKTLSSPLTRHIGLANSSTYDGATATTTKTFSSFDMNGGNALAVAISLENASATFSVTFGGDSLIKGVESADTGVGAQRTLIYYLVNPANTNADLTVTCSASDYFGVSVFSLSNVYSAGVSNAGGNTDGSSIALNYSSGAGDYLIAAAMDNGYDGSGQTSYVPTLSGDNSPALLQGIRGAVFGDGTKGGFAHWYAPITVAGSFTNTVSFPSTSTSRNSASLLTFVAATAPTPVAPAAATNLTATAISASQIDLSWSAAPGADSYTIKRATSSGGPYTNIVAGVTVTNYSDTGLAENTTYYYVVGAVNTSGESNGAEASATTLIGTPPNLGVAINNGTLTISWPSNYTGWTLQYTTNLLSTNAWFVLPDSQLTNVFNYGTMTNDSLFFKLVNP